MREEKRETEGGKGIREEKRDRGSVRNKRSGDRRRERKEWGREERQRERKK